VSGEKAIADLRGRMAELSDLGSLAALMSWDQNTMMPPGGAEARADMAGTLIRTIHARQTDPEIDRLLSEIESWTDGMDPPGSARPGSA